jgi:excisionase family DNA binding protein
MLETLRKKGGRAVVTTEQPDYTVDDVARLLQVQPTTVRTWIKQGQLKAWLLGSKRAGYRITPEDLARFRAERGRD